MSKVGYIFRANNESFDTEKEWMLQHGCVQIIEETVEHETLRPLWKQLMSNLRRGDEIVVSKFSNATRGLRELAAFIEICPRLCASYPSMTGFILAVNCFRIRLLPMCCG